MGTHVDGWNPCCWCVSRLPRSTSAVVGGTARNDRQVCVVECRFAPRHLSPPDVCGGFLGFVCDDVVGDRNGCDLLLTASLQSSFLTPRATPPTPRTLPTKRCVGGLLSPVVRLRQLLSPANKSSNVSKRTNPGINEPPSKENTNSRRRAQGKRSRQVPLPPSCRFAFHAS